MDATWRRGDAAATAWIFRGTRRFYDDRRYETVAQTFGFASLDLSGLTRSSCAFPWADYIWQLEVATVWPLVVLVLMAVAYHAVKRVWPESAVADGNKWVFAAFLLVFLVFPNNSTLLFRFFNCIEFDARGDDPSRIKVLMADMSINCRSAFAARIFLR